MKTSYAVLVIGCIAAIIFFSYFYRSQASRKTEMPFPELLAHLDAEAIDIAWKSYGIRLDHSVESIENVEIILNDLHNQYQKHKTSEGKHGLALAFGVYIGEVIKRQHQDSHWAQDHPTIGPGSMPLHWNGNTSFPVAWCLKRLSVGQEENVWHKYQHFVTNRQNTKPNKSL